MPSTHESEDALGDLVDPELPASTYVLEPEAVAPLVARIVTSHDAGTHLPVHPFTGAPLVALPLSSAADVAAAVERARAAQRSWARVPVRERAAVLGRLGALLLERRSEILDLVQMESGTARVGAYEEVDHVVRTTRRYAARGARYLAARRRPGLLPRVTGTRVHPRPVGVVGVVAACHHPLALALTDAVPALLAGNAVVVEPDRQTTLTALWVAQQLEDAGLPAGLFSVVVGGPEVGAALVDRVDHVAFTGSTAAGRAVAARAGERLIGATLDLGGTSALYVAADADVASAVRGAVRACFAGTGRPGPSVERLVVHDAVADEFLGRFVAAVRELRLGAGLDYTAEVGSLVSAEQLDRVTRHVDDALARGARVLTGAVHRPDVGPYFYAPTVLDDVPPDALCRTEETAGPVVTVTRVTSDDEAVRAMEDTARGSVARIWSADVARARRLAARVEARTVVVNDAPDPGPRPGREAVEAVTRAQTVAARRATLYDGGLEGRRVAGGRGSGGALAAALRTLRRLRVS